MPQTALEQQLLNCPIISVNVRVWHFWSFLVKHDAMRYISIIPVGAMTLLMFADLYRAWGNIEEVIINAYFAVLYFNAVLRCSILVVNHDKYEKFLMDIARIYKDLQQIEDHEIKSLLQRYTKRARMLSIANLGLGAIISTCFVVYPLFAGGRELPYGMYIPGVNLFGTPQYEILFFLQVILTFPGCCMYIPFTSFFASCTLFGLVQVKNIQHQLRKLRIEGLKPSKLIEIIKDHQRVIDYVHDLNSLVTYICLVEFLSFGMMLCALLFLLNIIEHQAQFVIVAAYIFMIISQIYAFYWHGNELREQSMAIAKVAYGAAPWLEMKPALKKMVLLIILRAQRPLEVTVGNIYPMTLEVFTSLLNASYSYFTLLRRVYVK
ncbi:odorant receptor Or2 [Culex quinquefasciatus]|uniref:odorant receptor Or2 n=1 Tax=Culex quinquefasciatus TaxID=7176 RepID=UPI0018E32A57|nr:odorant receptor Or2 [Culex quinquefasciatus]